MKYLGLLLCGMVFSVLSKHDHDFSHHSPHSPHLPKSESGRSFKWILHGAFATVRDTSGFIAIAGAVVATVAGIGYLKQENRGTVRKWWDSGTKTFDNLAGRNQEKNFILDNLDLITLGGAVAFIGGGITYIVTKGLAHGTK